MEYHKELRKMQQIGLGEKKENIILIILQPIEILLFMEIKIVLLN